MLSSPMPKWKQIFFPDRKKTKRGYWNGELMTSQGAVSIRLIARAAKAVMNKKEICVAIPDLFCVETESEFCGKDIKVIRYPITEALDPDWEKLKFLFGQYEIAILIVVHYFGLEHDISRAKTLCRNRGAILVEDCAHCLYDYGKIGKHGDFAVFSPHKLLPVPDGSVIKVNENCELVSLVKQELEKELKAGYPMDCSSTFKWRLKKGIQKLVGVEHFPEFTSEVHYGDICCEQNRSVQISEYSKKVLLSYSYTDLKEIAFRRKINLSLMNYLVCMVDSSVICLTPDDGMICPYFAVFSLESVSDKQSLIKSLNDAGIKTLFWPTLSKAVAISDDYSVCRRINSNTVIVPIQQDIHSSWIVKRKLFTIQNETKRRSLELREVSHKSDREQWDNAMTRIVNSTISQDWLYGIAKEKGENWKAERYVVKKAGKPIGIVQLLKKRILGIPVARVFRGPVFIKQESGIDNELEVMDLLRKRKRFPTVWSYVPNTAMTPESYTKTIKNGWKNWNIHGIPSGTVNLVCTEDELRRGLNSKWRNQLKSAEKHGFEIQMGIERLDELLTLYESDQKSKGFVGISSPLLRSLAEMEDSPLRIFYIEDNDLILAFDMFYEHGNAATYYVGYNSDLGRKMCLNNLLLYHAAVYFQKKGKSCLDLGGIEYVYTEEIAKFKDGMSPVHYQLMGEMMRIG